MKYGILLGVILFLGACSNKQKGEFTDEELAWLVYEEGDTIDYVSNDEEQHQLVVNYRTDLSQIKSYYPIEAEVEISSPDGPELFRIYLLKDEQEFKKYLRLSEVYRAFDLLQPTDTFSMNDQSYQNVYVFKEDTTDNDPYVWKLFFNKEYGILKYITKDNVAYEMINEQPQS